MDHYRCLTVSDSIIEVGTFGETWQSRAVCGDSINIAVASIGCGWHWLDVAGYDFQLLSSGKGNDDVDEQVVSLAVVGDDFTMGGDVGGTAMTTGGTRRCIVG